MVIFIIINHDSPGRHLIELLNRCCQSNANWSQYRPGDTRFMPKVDAIRPALRRGFV